MPSYLIALNLGPVQGFIATARRTRDLWFGSWVLSEISKAAARSLKDADALLIFPSPPDTDLAEGSEASVANRVLAEIAAQADPDKILGQAQEAASNRWRELAEWSLANTGLTISTILREDVWNTQRDDLLEYTWAWVQRRDGEPFRDAHERLKRLEAARKTTRDFQPAALRPTDTPGFGLPKSSLDGARETVLRENLSARTRRRLGLGPGEHLDCPGLVKRLCGGEKAEQFTPVSRIALDPWLQQIPAGELQATRDAYEPLVKMDLATRVKSNGNIYEVLSYDSQLLFPSRLPATLAKSYLSRITDEEERREVEQKLKTLRTATKPLWDKYGDPCPYVALLMADGDRMGELLHQAQQGDDGDAERLREISARLAKFAAGVPDVVRAHRGHCVYAGGDDVLALVPLHAVLDCSHALHEAFGGELRAVAERLGMAKPPTLSVGIGIQHFMSPLGELRDLAKRAEALAKGDTLAENQQRDGLGIIVQTRSGAPLAFRDRWTTQPQERLKRWIELISADALPDKAPYDLREAARRLEWASGDTREAVDRAEARRILARKRAEAGTKELAQEHAQVLLDFVRARGLAALADELLVCRWLAQRVRDRG